MIVAVLLNHVLDAVGMFFVITTAVKISRGYPAKRWFF